MNKAVDGDGDFWGTSDESEVENSLTGKLRHARKGDYERWLSGYVANGNQPTHHYDYPWTELQMSFSWPSGTLGLSLSMARVQ